MPIYHYQKNGTVYTQVGNIALAGRNGIIQRSFDKSKLRDQLSTLSVGIPWDISKQELQSLMGNDDQNAVSSELVFDVEPAKKRTNLLQLEHIYAYSHNYGETGTVYWTVMLLHLKPVLFSPNTVLDKLKFEPDGNDALIKEFLYLRGDAEGWTFGSVGRMNGALIEPEAQAYFRKFF